MSDQGASGISSLLIFAALLLFSFFSRRKKENKEEKRRFPPSQQKKVKSPERPRSGFLKEDQKNQAIFLEKKAKDEKGESQSKNLPIKKMLRSSNSLKNAIVLSEILKRKDF